MELSNLRPAEGSKHSDNFRRGRGHGSGNGKTAGKGHKGEGTGVIAGGPARAVIELAGIKNIRTKCMGSRNKQNVVLATIAGLSQLKTPEEVAKLRGKSVDEILG